MTTKTVYKRYRMEIDLDDLAPVPMLPFGYSWLSWDETTLEDHASVKFQAFHREVDAEVFENLSHLEGCLQLMQIIRAKPTFCPDATWMILGANGPVGTVQGVLDFGVGSLQNVGIIPGHRGLGLGTALILKSLESFRQMGIRRGGLEVTARNIRALRMYRRMGFYVRKTLYREVETKMIPLDVVV